MEGWTDHEIGIIWTRVVLTKLYQVIHNSDGVIIFTMTCHCKLVEGFVSEKLSGKMN